jgi:hypothetical protein
MLRGARLWRKQPARSITDKHIEGCRAPAEEQDQLSRLDLTDLPPADLVADVHSRDFCRRAGANNGTRSVTVHDNAQQHHVGGWRWWRRRRRGDYRRRRRGLAGRRKQRSLERCRKAVERLRRQGASGRRRGSIDFGSRWLLGRQRGPRRGRQDHSYERRSAKRHVVSRRQTARRASVMRNSGSSTGRCVLTAGSSILSVSTNT